MWYLDVHQLYVWQVKKFLRRRMRAARVEFLQRFSLSPCSLCFEDWCPQLVVGVLRPSASGGGAGRLDTCVCLVTGEVVQVPRGLDATLRCRSETSPPPKWEWDSNQTSSNIKTLVVNSTAYLLVENFQEMNEGLYYCINGTGKTAVKLEIQPGVKDTALVYRISRTGSLHLFCDAQLGAALEGFWSWRQTGSEEDGKRSSSGQPGSEGDCKRSGSDLEHFGNRSEVKKNESDNKFSLSISPLLWDDSGQYKCALCDGDKLHKQCTYEIITVKVYSEPVELTEGEDGSLVCAVSHVTNVTRLLWIDTQSHLRFSSPEAQKHTGEFRLAVRNVTLAQNAWACAVFHQGQLRALVPFTLTVKTRATQPPAPSAGGNGLIYLPLVCLSGLLLITVGTAFIIYRCRRHQGDEQTPDDDGAVHYAAVNFKMKKAADSSTSAALDTDNLTPEEDSVIYADVVLATGI